MKIDSFINSCFSNKKKLVVPKNNDIPKLKKTWGKIISNFEQNYSPKTQEIKKLIEQAKKEEEDFEFKKAKILRFKRDAENKLSLYQKEDKLTLKKLTDKFHGKNLSKELNRLKELPIESLILVDKPKQQISEITPPEDSLLRNALALGTSPVSLDGYPADSVYVNRNGSLNSVNSPSSDHKPLPYLVIFTSPLKTKEPSVEELKPFSVLKRRQIKTWANKDIGRFIIIIDLEEKNRNGLTVWNLDKITDGIYDHACIREGSVCFGNRAETYDKLVQNYQIFDMIDLTFDLLQSITTARPVSKPHCEWSAWFERSENVNSNEIYNKITNYLKTGHRINNSYSVTWNRYVDSSLENQLFQSSYFSPTPLPPEDPQLTGDVETELMRYLQTLELQSQYNLTQTQVLNQLNRPVSDAEGMLTEERNGL